MRLQDHQEIALNAFINSKSRGMLLLHGTGSGKTLSAVAIAERFKRFPEVIVIAPKSLHDNFKKELNRYTKDDEKSNTDRYRYVSANASNMISKLEQEKDIFTGLNIQKMHLDNKFIITCFNVILLSFIDFLLNSNIVFT